MTHEVPSLPRPRADSGKPPDPGDGPARPLEDGFSLLCPREPGPALSAELMGLSDPSTLGGDGAAGVRDRRLHAALVAPVRYLLDAGGKRWRAHLMTLVLEMFDAGGRHYAELVAACEMGHAGSLMVDDVEDGSPVRRGGPAAHTVFGEATAINAGTAAYFSLDRAIRNTFPRDAALRLAVYETYLAHLRATHAGQALDIQGHDRELEHALTTGDTRPLLEMLTLTHRLKTGAQVRAMCEIGALAGRAGPRQRAALGAFGEALGLAYQIIDDVGDLRGVVHREKATKRVADDLRNAKVTFPLAHAVALLPRAEAAALWRAVREEPDGPGEEALRCWARTIEDSGAVKECEERAARLLDEAGAAARPYLPESPRTEALFEAAARVVHRSWSS
ncbi:MULTISPECIES: polyprenyl synthetase family protein [Streptomyces]|uniref:Polyprenyl synthetase family protein n=1 Tax=Streptomyces cacaoi TaxID=1898 RepID=A0A4Y3R1S0_STRCI|nr:MULTISPECIES: polyprenyl synthetase family protein [Streptomyces]NNG85005.1 polyprenyl synthetase family protein [Streptomyces cacaoi]GEB50713.1 hypothetical protein SCA03_32640 [Streptomyces cacaoi]